MLPRIHLAFLIIYGATARRNRLPPLGWCGRVGTTDYANNRSSTLEILSSQILPDVGHFEKYLEPKCKVGIVDACLIQLNEQHTPNLPKSTICKYIQWDQDIKHCALLFLQPVFWSLPIQG